jgi:hypothetical protein
MIDFCKFGKAYEVQQNLVQSALLPVDCLRSRCQLICNLLYFKRRYQCFSNFKFSVHNMKAILERFEAVFRMGAQIKTHALNYNQGGDPACLQEMIVLLHRAEIDATKAIIGHVLSLKSHRRCFFLSCAMFEENASSDVKGTQEDLMDKICRKGWASIDMIYRSTIEECDALFPIKGVGSRISSLLRLRCLSGIVADLVTLCSGKLTSDEANRLNEIKDIAHRWTQDSLPVFLRQLICIDKPLFVRLNQGQYAIQLHKEVWRCLTGLFHLKKLGWADKQCEGYSSVHFLICRHYQLIKHLKCIQHVRLVQVSGYLPGVASDISHRILKLERTGASSVTWSSASMEQFVEDFKQVTDLLTNIWSVTRNNDKLIQSFNSRILNCCFKEGDACHDWESTVRQTTNQICASIQLNIRAWYECL